MHESCSLEVFGCLCATSWKVGVGKWVSSSTSLPEITEKELPEQDWVKLILHHNNHSYPYEGPISQEILFQSQELRIIFGSRQWLYGFEEKLYENKSHLCKNKWHKTDLKMLTIHQMLKSHKRNFQSQSSVILLW